MLSFPWVLNLDYLEPNIKTLWYNFALVKGELYHNYTLDIFRPENIFLFNDETGQVKNHKGKYIMELSKLKRLQCYINTFELKYIKSECNPQRHQFSTTFHHTIEELFETLYTVDVYIPTVHSIVDPIFNRDFGNNFHHQNGPNQHQHVHKPTGRQYQYISFCI